MSLSKSSTKIIGITGGIGSGKSTVAQMIADSGYKVVSTDEIAKQLLLESDEIHQKIKSHFPPQAMLDGKPNNKEIAKLAFDYENKFKYLHLLNSFIHPPVIDWMLQETQKAVLSSLPALFIESALIFEAGLGDGFDLVISIYCPPEIALERTMSRSNLTYDEVISRMDSQLSPMEKRKKSDLVIINDKDLATLKSSVDFTLAIIFG